MDIYAVGLLVYEILTGTQAFAESSPQATLAAQLTRMPRDLSAARPDIPPPLSALVMKMLAKNPDDRPQTAAAALNELDAIVTPTGVTAPRPVAGRSKTQTWALVAAALLVIAIGLAALMNRRENRPTTPPAVGATTSATPIAERTNLGTATKVDSAAKRPPPPATGGGTKATATAPTSTKTTPSTKSASTAGSVTPSAGAKTASTVTKSSTTKTTPLTTRPTVPLLNRRVAVLPFRVNTNRENIGTAAQAIHDSLRKALVAAGYTLATDSELLRLVTQQNMSGGLRRAADAAGMGAVVTVDVVARSDEANAVAQVLDVWRNQTSSGREAADLDKPLELHSIVRTISRSLDRVAWRSRTDPRRAIVFEVENQTGIDTLVTVARQLEDSLRAAVTRAGAIALPMDSIVRATKDVTERRTLAIRRGAGALVAASIFRVRADSMMIRLSVRDMSEERTFPNVENRVGIANVSSSFSTLAARLVEMLGQVNWGPKVVQ